MNCFLISTENLVLWVLITSTSTSTHNMYFRGELRKYQYCLVANTALPGAMTFVSFEGVDVERDRHLCEIRSGSLLFFNNIIPHRR